MIRFAVNPPHSNAKAIGQDSPSVLGVGKVSNPWATGFNIGVPAELTAVAARVLPAPNVTYAQRKSLSVRDGCWNMAGNKVTVPGNLSSWVPIFLVVGGARPAVQQQEAAAKVHDLCSSLVKLGINVSRPGQYQAAQLPDPFDENADFDKELREKVFEVYARRYKYLLIVLPAKSDRVYKRIKFYADVVYGVQCTCVVSTHLTKSGPPFDQYIANVGLKINIKSGGRNQGMDDAKTGIFAQDKTMAVGIDVTHPSPGSSDTAPSVAAMVANVDRYLGQYPAVLRVQARRKDEMVADLDEMLQTRLKLWLSQGKHKEYPENILVFRDGVSEGQYHLVLQNELSQLRKACEKLYPAAAQKQGLPRFFVAVCGKRHNTRFYPTKVDDADQGSNCKPGTVVDRGITEARHWEFFLQAHKCLQGTARPAHFFIIEDEVFSNKAVVAKLNKSNYNVADIVEEMCHHMAYLHPRATKAVSLCPPAKLADMACERARAYLQSYYDPTMSATASQSSGAAQNTLSDQRNLINVHANLKDTMFYI